MASRKRYSWILVCCAAALFTIIIFAPSYGWRVRQWLDQQDNGLQPAPADISAAVSQNEALSAQLAQLQGVMAQIPQNPQNEIRSMVYLQYPFGFRNQLLVDAGSDEGIQVGKAATFQGIFIGTVTQAFSGSAIVQTIFDPAFKMPVRIGSRNAGNSAGSYDALLIGGADPRATSISKSAALAPGDVVYTAAPGLPYGLPIATMAATTTSADDLFQEASLNFIYDENDIQTLLIAR